MNVTTITIRIRELVVFVSALAALVACVQPQWVLAQQNPRYYFFNANAAPGELAFQSLLANPNWISKVQPVRLIVPETAVVSVWNQGVFEDAAYVNPTLGLSIGPVYRFRVSNIPRTDSAVVFPSIELVNQLNPPAGLETRFPINVVLAEEDLRAAAAGRMVIKVIYLENPDTALPYRQMQNDQPYLDVGENDDPLRTAERLGRPMAIVRLGSRIPSQDEMNAAYAYSGIPLTLFPENYSRDIEDRCKGIEQVSFGNSAMGPLVSAGTNMIRPTSTPNKRQEGHSGCGDPNCGCGSQQWQGFSCDVPMWSNEAAIECNSVAPSRDEYLCDGDDRNLPVAISKDGSIVGLDLEDTIGHFENVEGHTKITSSNRVCIYSPRFAAVRRLSQTVTTTDTAKVSSVRDRQELNLAKATELSSTTMQQVQIQGNKGATRAGSFIDETRGVLAESLLVPSGFRQGYEPFENLQLMRLGKHRSSEGARLSLGMQAAGIWEDIKGLQVAERDVQPVITRDPLRVQEIRTVESENKSQLRLCKVASKISAEPGEEVEFSIRFDNVGATIINKVTIIDNLTTRLEYVPESAECSKEAVFTAEQNDGNSLVLSWKITESLPVGQGGLIRFRCRVR